MTQIKTDWEKGYWCGALVGVVVTASLLIGWAFVIHYQATGQL